MLIKARFGSLSSFHPPPHSWTRTTMRSLTVDSLNPALAIKAEEYRVTLKEKGQDSGLPFDRIISSNIGNPQQKGLDQPPITFNRQVAALMEWPQLMQLAPNAFRKMSLPVRRTVRKNWLHRCIFALPGVPLIRQNVAQFIQVKRDGHPSSPDNIFLTGGASAGVSLLISMLSRNPQIWAALKKAKEDGIDPKALVIINPGNPTGALEVAKLCAEHKLVLLADEVYQSNLHRAAEFPFTSFRSISKGVTGECGRRGGYFECHNIPDDVRAMMYKMVSVGLCPPLQGQIGDESYTLWKEETTQIHKALAQRTKLMAERLNNLPDVSCVNSPGALYLYPRITLSEEAIAAARAAGKEPDAFYALALLDATGICVVPGSGFGQKEGEYHYRLTCLCPGVDEYVGKLEKFHREFTAKYQ
ncbi:pyridoxal phosphate-dependent transferase [Suillus spraguei]|nr:pyridoxal phosphate-dependent transferase [Suillus spraguei]